MHCWASNSPATIIGALFSRGNCTLVLILTEGLLVGEHIDLEYLVAVFDMPASVTSL
jgi:hypothetical protein